MSMHLPSLAAAQIMHTVCKMALHDLGCLEEWNIAHSTSSHGFACELLQVDAGTGVEAAAAVMGCCCASAIDVGA